LYLFVSLVCALRDLLSFPTRRSSDLGNYGYGVDDAWGDRRHGGGPRGSAGGDAAGDRAPAAVRGRFGGAAAPRAGVCGRAAQQLDRKSTRLNSSHVSISYAVFCLKKK